MASIADHIVTTPDVCGGRPRIAGHRIRVQDVAVWHLSSGMSAEQIVAEYPQLTLADVHAALAYCFDHLDEIKRDLKNDETFVDSIKAQLGPGPLAKKLAGDNEAPDAIPTG